MPSGTKLGIPLAINNRGQILFLGSGDTAYSLLTPSVPEPSTLVLTVFGLAALAISKRRAASR